MSTEFGAAPGQAAKQTLLAPDHAVLEAEKELNAFEFEHDDGEDVPNENDNGNVSDTDNTQLQVKPRTSTQQLSIDPVVEADAASESHSPSPPPPQKQPNQQQQLLHAHSEAEHTQLEIPAEDSCADASSSNAAAASGRAGRQYLRSTVQAVGDRASQMISATKSSSCVAKFTLDRVERLVEPMHSFTAGKWVEYGEPLLTSLDDRIDSVVSAICTVTTTTPKAGAMHDGSDGDDERDSDSEDGEEQHVAGAAADEEEQHANIYWERLKRAFIESHWFQVVDSILTQNVGVVTKHVVRPAEFFFNSAAECYLGHDNFDGFLEALRERLGLQWDDRLTQPSKVFFATARTAAAIVGVGRFFSGAIRLGRAKINTAIDQLIIRWEQVLGATENVVVRWLPDRCKTAPENQSPAEAAAAAVLNRMLSEQQQHLHDQQQQEQEHVDIDEESEYHSDTETEFDSNDIGSLHELDDISIPPEDCGLALSSPPSPESLPPFGAATLSSGSNSCSAQFSAGSAQPFANSNGTKRRRVTEMASNMPRRVKQRILTASEIGGTLKRELSQLAWFQTVDAILKENAIVRSLGVLAHPAEHFYQTAVSTFLDSSLSSVDSFVEALQHRMGSAWDARLASPAHAFYGAALQQLRGRADDELSAAYVGTSSSSTSCGTSTGASVDDGVAIDVHSC